ncbi:hypothetical protein MGSAQ_003058, partial [marine sediment metagenome]
VKKLNPRLCFSSAERMTESFDIKESVSKVVIEQQSLRLIKSLSNFAVKALR